MSTGRGKELGKVSDADINRFVRNGGVSDYFAAIAPNFPGAGALFAAFLLVTSLYGLPVAQQYLDKLNKRPPAEFQIQTSSQPIIEVYPRGAFRDIVLESIPVGAPVRQLLQLIPPNVRRIVILDGPVAGRDHILSEGMHIFPVSPQIGIEDLISLARDWETSLQAANQLGRKTLTYRGAFVEYTSQDALRDTVARLDRLSSDSELRVVRHSDKGFRVITPVDAAQMGNVANTIIRRTIDVLAENGVKTDQLEIKTIGSVADGTMGLDRATGKASDVDFAVFVKDPRLFLEIVNAVDHHSARLEQEVDAAFQRAFEGRVLTPNGNHMGVFLLSELGEIMDMTVVALGQSTKP